MHAGFPGGRRSVPYPAAPVKEQEVALTRFPARLHSVPGFGPNLSMTILLESGAIERFDSAGDHASYCRMVESVRLSNGKRKGHGNRKRGNRYLCWA